MRTFLRRRRQVHMVTGGTFKVKSDPRNLYSITNLDRLRSLFEVFDIRIAFQLELLLCNSVLDPTSIISIVPSIRELASKYAVEKVERMLQWFIFAQQPIPENDTNFSPTPRAQFTVDLVVQLQRAEGFVNSDLSLPVDSWLAHSRRITITPTGLHLEGPIVDQSNSFLRRTSHPDNYVRVSLRDDDLENYATSLILISASFSSITTYQKLLMDFTFVDAVSTSWVILHQAYGNIQRGSRQVIMMSKGW